MTPNLAERDKNRDQLIKTNAEVTPHVSAKKSHFTVFDSARFRASANFLRRRIILKWRWENMKIRCPNRCR